MLVTHIKINDILLCNIKINIRDLAGRFDNAFCKINLALPDLLSLKYTVAQCR